MATLALDTYEIVKDLKAAGFNDQQAEAVTRVFSTTRGAFDLATKQDIREVRAELREMELRLSAKIETKVEAAKSEIIKWMFGTMGFQTLVILGAVIALTKVGR